ncbi:MAG: DUF5752 family protein [Candidatus Omnitrophica bacterium]|nr:DUF5752 family protein [Candidatus Omnitrophota bacterium]
MEREPFQFYTRFNLSELTGLKASTAGELLALLREVPGACMYHHTHRFLQQHLFVSPEPPNDFAYWVREALGEDELAEQLASVNIIDYPTIRAVRERFIFLLEDYLGRNPAARERACRGGEEFQVIKSVSFIVPTGIFARTLAEFTAALAAVSLPVIYFHMFEARLRLEKGNNDFSNWLADSLGQTEAAEKIARIDPYTFTLDGLRAAILQIIQKTTAR